MKKYNFKFRFIFFVIFAVAFFLIPKLEVSAAAPPMIINISPNPVSPISGSQWITINGSDFVFGLQIILRTGNNEVYYITNTSSGWVNSAQIKIYPNLTAKLAQWTAQMVNPDGQQSNQFSFSVGTSVAPTSFIPTAPSNLIAVGSSNNILMRWNDNSNNETGFTVERKTGRSGTYSQITQVGQGVTAYQDSGLSLGTTYCYRVSAYNTGGSASSSEACTTILATPALSSPDNSAQAGVNSVTLQWNVVTGANGYKINLGTACGATNILNGSVASVPNINATSLANGTYFWQVQAVNASALSAMSDCRSFTVNVAATPIIPALSVTPSNQYVSTTAGSTTFNVTNASSGAMNWTASITSGSSWLSISSGASGANSGVINIQYAQNNESSPRVAVVTVSASGATGSPKTITVTQAASSSAPQPLIPNAPSNLIAVGSSNNILMRWNDNSNNETGFTVERKTGRSGTYSQIAQVGQGVTAYQDSGLSLGTTYCYRVSAYNTGGSASSNEACAIALATPVLSSPAYGATVGVNSVTLQWNGVVGANAYAVNLGTACGATGILNGQGTSVPSIAVISLANGTYFWQVKALSLTVNAQGASTMSDCRYFTVNVVSTPVTPALSVTPSNQSVSATTGSTAFNVMNAGGGTMNWTASVTSGSSWLSISSGVSGVNSGVINVQYAQNNNSSWRTAEVTVIAIGVAGSPKTIQVIQAASVPPAPSIPIAPSNTVATALSSSRVALSWQDNANNESGFKVERKASGGAFSQINTTGIISGSDGYYEDAGLSGGTNYCYRVRAYNSTGDSAYSNETCATTTASPSVQPVVNTGSVSNITVNSVTLNGAVNPNGVATGAFFQWSSNSSTFGNTTPSQTIGNGAADINVSANLTGLIPATTYYFRTVAVNGAGGTVFGATQTFTTSQVSQAPTPKPTAKISANPSNVTSGSQVTITWSSTDATSCTVNPTGWTGTSGGKIETLVASKTYTLDCSGAGGSADTVSVTVTVGIDQIPLPADLVIENFTIDKQSVNAGENVKLQFVFKNRSGSESSPFSAKLVLSTDQSLGNEDAELYKNNFASIKPNFYWGWFGSDYLTVYIPQNTATGNYHIGIVSDSSIQKSLPLTVTGISLPPKPTAKIIANPSSISSDSSVTISWSSKDATSCKVDPTGWTGTSDSKTETLTASKTYTLNCSGQGGSASDTITVNVSGEDKCGTPFGSPQEEVSIAKTLRNGFRQDNGIKVQSTDSQKAVRLKIIWDRILVKSLNNCRERAWQQHGGWELSIVDIPNGENAYSSGAGVIDFGYFEYKGVPLNDDEIAFILSHEIAHSLLDHTPLLILRADLLSGTRRRIIIKAASPLCDLGIKKYCEIIELVDKLERKVFSREQEAAADSFALSYMSAAGFDIKRGAVSLLQKWVADETDAEAIKQDYNGSHPSDKLRLNSVFQRLDELPTPLPYDEKFRVELDAEFAYMQSAEERIKMLKESFAGVTLREKVQKWLYKYLSIGQFDSYNGLVNLAEENYRNYSRELFYSRDYYNKGEIINAKKDLNDARILRDSLNRTISTAYSLLGGVIGTAGKVAEAPARVNIAAFKFSCIFAGESMTVKLCQALMKPLDFAVDYGMQGMDNALQNQVTDIVVNVVFSKLPISELNNQTLKKAIESGITDGIQHSQIQIIAAQLLKNPQLAQELFNALTKAGVYGADEIVKNILKKIITTNPAPTIGLINAEATMITIAPASEVALGVNEKRDMNRESQTYSKYVSALTGVENIKIVDTVKFTNFITYGTETTKSLGAGERAGVVNSFQSAFGKLPVSESEWSDVIKIGNGRWPSETSATAETSATKEFKKVYKRSPNMKQTNDNAAVTVMAYGLRPNARNFNSEAAAIRSFNYIFKRAPYSANDWDIVRAIAYSGAKK